MKILSFGAGTQSTALALMACDIVISAMAMIRYVERSQGITARNAVDQFVDYQYPDSFIEWIWPNLRIE